jgi:hypothetical protein
MANSPQLKLSSDREELEKQIATILSTYTAPKNVVDSHNNTYYDATFLEAKRKLLALFARHTQVAVEEDGRLEQRKKESE